MGVSENPERPSYQVAKYLLENSHYELYFVNPAAMEIFGKTVYKSLSEIKVPIDLVDVFRKPADCMQVLEDSIAISAASIWLQLGISVPEVAAGATAAGMNVVMDRCIKIDYQNLIQ